MRGLGLAGLFAIVGLGLIAACASISEEGCRQSDWRGVGFADGAAGRDSGYIQRHAEACGKIGIAPDVAVWQAGRSQGLPLYCTPANAFEIGQRGGRLNAVCQGFDPVPLARANAQGLRYYAVDREISAVQSEIYAANARIDDLLEGEITPEVRHRIRYLRADVERGYRSLRRLEQEQRFYAYLL